MRSDRLLKTRGTICVDGPLGPELLLVLLPALPFRASTVFAGQLHWRGSRCSPVACAPLAELRCRAVLAIACTADGEVPNGLM